ncbi:MAG: hypothetical protein JWN78_538 [Bacteroidota bacterium]|nr:hypothetical protein [Bacteroidota bacterium]
MKRLSILLLFVSAVISCNKPGIEKGTPECVVNKIQEFSKSYCYNAKVEEYVFQGKIVYVFDPGACGADMQAEVINSKCNTLGYLGGFAGNTKINGEEFSHAVFINTTWKK